VRRLKKIAGTETAVVLEVETQEFEERQAELKSRFPGKVVMFKGRSCLDPSTRSTRRSARRGSCSAPFRA
jgi:hypothetical protein